MQTFRQVTLEDRRLLAYLKSSNKCCRIRSITKIIVQSFPPQNCRVTTLLSILPTLRDTAKVYRKCFRLRSTWTTMQHEQNVPFGSYSWQRRNSPRARTAPAHASAARSECQCLQLHTKLGRCDQRTSLCLLTRKLERRFHLGHAPLRAGGDQGAGSAGWHRQVERRPAWRSRGGSDICPG